MEKTSGYRIKIVEEMGEKILDILHTSYPWKGEDCGRQKCLLCSTKEMTGKGKKQDCKNRSLVYETWCETCAQKDREKKDMEDIPEEETEKKKKEIKIHKYVGETAISAFERGLEHLNALEKLDEDSHMLKHIANDHTGKEIENIKFGMKVVSYTRTQG